ncbi:mediator of RNA polymerase II transcription subunit 12-like protein [Galendromus occidentalis]|uniref:Mediator of RNA polymerase II transcription subunit 12-like protein n=1 Tax=Galendromus occidentalis TaxID=34638 RepID=A0AAJ7SEB6_9ACAR|nr:mediator of RNA polymerase II transcription subunit 12-like protein [Galendromus occidentalis]
MAAVAPWLFEKRALKRPRLGPPDVYPQDPKQKEDEITATNVKQGYSANPIQDECGSARNSNITAAKFGAFFSGILAKKQEINTLIDSGRKKQQINIKECFWPVTAKSKSLFENWFKDLAGSKPLTSLSKKVPFFNKKEELFTILFEFQVPTVRAAWFVKMASVYTAAISEAKLKKRQLPDPSQDWTHSLCKFMKELLLRMVEQQQPPQASPAAGSQGTPPQQQSPPAQSPPTDQTLVKHWQYLCQLASHCYQDGLLDQQDFLVWSLELVERTKGPDDPTLRITLPLIMQYSTDFAKNEMLSRRLIYQCCKKVAQLVTDFTPKDVGSVPKVKENNSNTEQELSPLSQAFVEIMSCSYHRNTFLNICALIQMVTLDCPSALVFNQTVPDGVPKEDVSSRRMLNGSPLDILPCSPSQLPIVPDSPEIRKELREAEEMIVQRSRACEMRWSCEKWQSTATGAVMTKVLATLDALDRHSFDRVDNSNSFDTLYVKVFAEWPNPTPSHHEQESGKNNFVQELEPLVKLFCEWAVTTKRRGEHRALIVAKLLERKQHEINPAKDDDEEDSTSPPIFQDLLVKFLDNQAPILDEKVEESRLAFANLVLLFSEFIRWDVFSHDLYMCTLISRGYFANTPAVAAIQTTTAISSVPPPGACSSRSVNTPPASSLGFLEPNVGPSPGIGFADSRNNAPNSQGSQLPLFEPGGQVKQEDAWGGNEGQMDMDDTNVDADIDKIVQRISQGQQSDQPELFSDSVGSDREDGKEGSSHLSSKQLRHLQYTTHFPLPTSDLDGASHESNQRHVLLYGVGKSREEARHVVKKVAKDIMKLFSKKACMDISEGGKIKKHARESVSTEAIVQRFQSLPYNDQHAVGASVACQLLEIMNAFSSGASNYLPLAEYISFLFSLMEMAQNVNGLLELCLQMLKEIYDVELQLKSKASALAGVYVPTVTMNIVGLLYRYHCCLLASQEQTMQACDSLCRLVANIEDMNECSSAKRCTLCYVHDLYQSCIFLKQKYADSFLGSLCTKIKQTLYAPQTPSILQLVWKPTQFAELIACPKSRPEPAQISQLNENPAARFSFLCNAVIAIANCRDLERLNDVSILCAEMTAGCSQLPAEWLGVLKALCCSANNTCGYPEMLSKINLSDTSIHDNIAVFASILVARRCFSLQDFVVHVAIPSLLAASPVSSAAHGDENSEKGARLTCHLLLRLFRTMESITGAVPVGKYLIKTACDRHLLLAAHNSMRVEPVLAVLKAILLLGDTEVSTINPQLFEDADTLIIAGKEPLAAFAKFALVQICSQQWVHERCLRDPDILCTPDLLLDPMLTNPQAEKLLGLICYPQKSNEHRRSDSNADHRQQLVKILSHLDQWSLRVSWLQLQLMHMQCQQNSALDVNHWLDNVARASIDVFQLSDNAQNLQIDEKRNTTGHSPVKRSQHDTEFVWFVAPLVSKLQGVQGKILRQAGHTLESGNWTAYAAKKDTKACKGAALLHHQPFLSLMLSCLKGHDEHRESLLKSLTSQINQALNTTRDDKTILDDLRARKSFHEALLLRLSLLGGMFDMIQRSTAYTMDWALIFIELITTGLVDSHSHKELFYTVLDMLSTLIHTSYEGTFSEDSRRQYFALIKKLKKEVNESSQNADVRLVLQLLPFPKRQCTVITCEPMGSLIDTKGNKIAGFDSIDKKQGLQVAEKQNISPWDLLEGHKNPAPLMWKWFGAVRVERKPTRQEETYSSLLWHTHNSLIKSSDYFLDPPQIPQEDLDPPPSISMPASKPMSNQLSNVMQNNNGPTGPHVPITNQNQNNLMNNYGAQQHNNVMNTPISQQNAMGPPMMGQGVPGGPHHGMMDIKPVMAHPNHSMMASNPIQAGQSGQPPQIEGMRGQIPGPQGTNMPPHMGPQHIGPQGPGMVPGGPMAAQNTRGCVPIANQMGVAGPMNLGGPGQMPMSQMGPGPMGPGQQMPPMPSQGMPPSMMAPHQTMIGPAGHMGLAGSSSPTRGARKPRQARRPRKPKASQAQPVAQAQPAPTAIQAPRGQMAYGDMYPPPQGPGQAQQQTWAYGNPPVGQQGQPGQYYNQGPQPSQQMQRFERQPTAMSQSKAALSTMLRQRHPPSQSVAQPAYQANQPYPGGMQGNSYMMNSHRMPMMGAQQRPMAAQRMQNQFSQGPPNQFVQGPGQFADQGVPRPRGAPPPNMMAGPGGFGQQQGGPGNYQTVPSGYSHQQNLQRAQYPLGNQGIGPQGQQGGLMSNSFQQNQQQMSRNQSPQFMQQRPQQPDMQGLQRPQYQG